MAADELPSISSLILSPGGRLHQADAAATGVAPPRSSLDQPSMASSGSGEDGSLGSARPGQQPVAASRFAWAPYLPFFSTRDSDLRTLNDAPDHPLTHEAHAELATAVPSATSSRLAERSRQLVELVASLSSANASMLLDRGYSLVVPVLPSSIFEHTLVARPNFKLRCVPPCRRFCHTCVGRSALAACRGPFAPAVCWDGRTVHLQQAELSGCAHHGAAPPCPCVICRGIPPTHWMFLLVNGVLLVSLVSEPASCRAS